MLFWGEDFLSAAEKIYSSGGRTVEFWRTQGKDIKKMKRFIDEKGMEIHCFCVDSSSPEISEAISKDILTAGKKEEFMAALRESVAVVKFLGAKALIITLGDDTGAPYAEQTGNILSCLLSCAGYLEQEGVELLLEPIHKGEREHYIEPHAKPVTDIIKAIGSPNIKLLYDIYHQAKTGDLSADFISENIEYIGHFHAADTPDRSEPGEGDTDYPSILKAIKNSGYRGYIGLECKPKKDLGEIIKYMDQFM